MHHRYKDIIFLCALVALMGMMLVVSEVRAEFMELLEVQPEEVTNEGLLRCFTRDNDDDCFFCAPAQQLAEADHVNNIIIDGNGGITLDRDGDGQVNREGSFTSPVIRGQRFTDVQISYLGEIPPGSSVRLEIRPVRDGVPGTWREASREGEINFDASVDNFQYRLVMSSNGSSAPSVSQVTFMGDEPAPTASSLAPAPAPGAPITVAAPPIVEREQWGARKAKSGSARGDRWDTLVVHHTAGHKRGYKGAESVRGTQRYHMDGRGWNDIAYHFVIGPDGVIYRGRPENVRGGHCPPNKGRLGIVVIGNYMDDTLDPAAEQSLKQLMAHLCGKYGLSSRNIYAHKELRATACPGTDILRRFDELKASVDTALSNARQHGLAD